MKDNTLIQTKDLCKFYKGGEIKALNGVSASITSGEVVVVIGPSGSGKSTFLRSLNLLEQPTSGTITFEGVEITDPKTDINIHRQKMGMVFQHFNLFNNKTVIENIMMAPVHVDIKNLRKNKKNPNYNGPTTKKEVKELESKAKDSYASVTGDNYKDDETMLEELRTNTANLANF